jgi:hypothetical protein
MATVYRQSPSSFNTQYQVDTTGDSYTLISGNSSTNYGVATVVNYSVAANIQNNSTFWQTVTPTFFNEKKSTILSALNDTSDYNTIKDQAYQITKTSYILFSNFDWVEQINNNADTLEYSVLRNDDPTYVNALRNAIQGGLIPIEGNTSVGTFLSVKSSVLSNILSGGGFGNPNRFFVVRNLVSRRGGIARGITGGKYGDYGNYEIYEKQNSGPGGVNGMTPVVNYRPEPGNCGVWLTDVYVDTTGGVPVFSFPNGGTTTRGEQFYRNVVTSFLQSAEMGG